MAGSIIGNIFKISTWGESHGKALGVTIDGCPAGICLCEDDIQRLLDRRRPGVSQFTTQRNEADRCEILSGVYDGKTTGTPISIIVWNKDQMSGDYDILRDVYRPGHADLCFDTKFGIRDHRGGGRSSGRETIGRVAAGAVAEKMLSSLGICFETYVKSIGDIDSDPDNIDISFASENDLVMADKEAYERAKEYVKALMAEMDSAGGTVRCTVKGVPAGIGEPALLKLDAVIAQNVMSIGAVKAVEIGDGKATSMLRGSENNDSFRVDNDKVYKKSNHSGGILGGISDGSDIIVTASFKPTPSIARPQETIDRFGNETSLEIKGRHDPLIPPRAAVVVESMTALAIADMILMNMSSKMDNLLKIYGNDTN